MATPKMRKMGQEDSEAQKPQEDRYKVRPSVGSQYEEEPTGMKQIAPNKFSVTPASEPTSQQVHIHMGPASMQRLPVYDDGGEVAPDPSSIDSAAQATPETKMHKAEDAIRRAGSAMDDPSAMPGQSANTHQYAIQGLDQRPQMMPMYDDGGVVNTTAKIGSKVVAPDDDSARGIATKNQMLDEYNAGVASEKPKEEEHSGSISNVDKVNTKAKYGDRPGEERIDVSNYLKPIGMVKMYDDGGPVKDDPNDGHHQMAVLEEGERVLTPEENAMYEQEHGAPVNTGGQVLQQPNPPVHPMMDTEHVADQPVGQGKMDTSNPPAADVAPAMMRTMSNTTAPKMEAPSGVTAPTPTPEGKPPVGEAGTPKMQGPDGGPVSGAAPEHNPMATTTSATPLPNEREKLEAERAALKQKMVDAAEGKFNNGKFDHVAYGEAKMALADLNKAHPWGQPGNHEGMLGKIGHGLAVAGELASDSVMGPGFTSMIPGTRENLNRQAGEGQQEITQGLAGKASEAETQLKQAQATMAGRPKDPKQGIAFETYRMAHSAPGTPEYESAKENLALYQQQDKQMNENKQAAKPELLPQDIAAQTRKVLSLPQGSPERTQAEQDLQYMEKQAQQQGKLTDRHREINDYAMQHGLNPDDPDQYAEAVMGYEKTKTAAKAEGGFPVWRNKANIQNDLALQRQQMQNIWADSTARGLEADKLTQKSNADYIKSSSQLATLQAALKLSDGNQVAANIVPLLSTLGFVADVGGVKRLNRQELEKFVPAQGSAARWLESNWDRITSGTLPADYQQELGSLVGGLQKTMDDNHKFYNQSIDDTIRKGGQEPVVEKTKTGTKVTPKPSTPQGGGGGTLGHKVGGTIVQNGVQYKVTKVDDQGKVLAADPIKK